MEARAAQRRHAEMLGPRPSPLGDVCYSPGAARLWRWVDSPADERVDALVANFRGLDDAARNSIRDDLTTDDFYTLWRFAIRYSFAALREGDPRKVEAAFNALAMIDLERIDWRDFSTPRNLARAVGKRIGAPIRSIAKQAARLATPQVRSLLLLRVPRVDLSGNCGYREVHTSDGVALFGDGFRRFAPKADLARLGYVAAGMLENESYAIETITMASELPIVWLDAQNDRETAKRVKRIKGCVSLRGEPGADLQPGYTDQHVSIAISEAANESDAQAIADLVKSETHPHFARIGISSRRLCVIMIQQSRTRDTSPREDAHTLERFRVQFEGLLAQG